MTTLVENPPIQQKIAVIGKVLTELAKRDNLTIDFVNDLLLEYNLEFAKLLKTIAAL